jgi:hypothetical protein
MRWWDYAWNRLKAIPAGLWAAVAAAGTLLLLYLRGRRLEAELAAERLKAIAAQSAAVTAKHEGRAEVHRQRADEHAQKAVEIAGKVAAVEQQGAVDKKRIATMPSSKVTQEYLAAIAADKTGEP